MSVKVKRGLGLLVVAVIALLAVVPTVQSSTLAANLVALVAGLTFVAALLGGLVLLAWGLLRD